MDFNFLLSHDILSQSFAQLSDVSRNDSFGWHFQFLTIIGLSVATLTFSAGSLSDLLLSKPLFRLKNILSVIATPLAVLISTLYWALRTINKELVIPPGLRLPLLPDLGFHAIPTILLITDLLFLSPPWTITILPATVLSTVLAFAYWYWIEICYAKNGFYPYPLFNLLRWEQRVALFAGSAIMTAGTTILLKGLYARVNGGVRR